MELDHFSLFMKLYPQLNNFLNQLAKSLYFVPKNNLTNICSLAQAEQNNFSLSAVANQVETHQRPGNDVFAIIVKI